MNASHALDLRVRTIQLPAWATLESHEMLMAATIGTTRHIAALKRGLQDRHGCNCEAGWQVHIEGACGELAVAKVVKLYWGGSVNTFKNGGDVGEYQVRTRSRHEYELIVRPDDNEESVYWLVTGIAPRYCVHGWILGRAAKRNEWWKTHGGREGAWFVPPSDLMKDFLP